MPITGTISGCTARSESRSLFGQTHYIWVEVDGVQHSITTNATHNAVSKSWDKLGVTAGTYHVFVDKMNLYVW
jgi:hypothetical protein